MWTVTELKKIALKKPILIAGLPGIGNVGKAVTDYLIEKKGAQPIMSFFSYTFPNSVFVNESNLVELPKIELYHAKNRGKDFLFLAGDVQPVTEEGSYSFTEKLLEILKKFGCEEIVTLGGIGLAEVPESPKVYCTGNDQKMIKKFIDEGAKPEIYGIVGPIIGISGLLVGMGTKKGIKAAALLAETYGHPMYLGLKGAKESMKILDRIYSLKVDYKDINKEIRLMESEGLGGEEKDNKLSRKLKKISETTYIG